MSKQGKKPTSDADALRAFRLLVGAYAVTSYGSYLNMVALNLYVYALTGSALGMGLFLVLRLASGAAAGLVAGALVARLSRKQIMLWSSVAQAVVLVLLMLSPAAARPVLLFCTAVTNGCGTTLFLVALRSAIPDLVGHDRRNQANSLIVMMRALGMVGGFASAGLVIAWHGYAAAFLVDAASFALCVVAVAFLPTTASDGTAREDTADQRQGKVLPKLGGLLVLMIGLRSVDAFGSSSHNAALPAYSALVARPNPPSSSARFSSSGPWATSSSSRVCAGGRSVTATVWDHSASRWALH